MTVNYCKLKGCLHQNICSTSIFFHVDDILVEDLQCVFDNIIFMNFSTNSTNTTRYYIRRSWSSTKLKKYEPFNWWPIAAAGISYGVWLLIIVFVGPDRINNACNYIENNYCVPTLTYLTLQFFFITPISSRPLRRNDPSVLHERNLQVM